MFLDFVPWLYVLSELGQSDVFQIITGESKPTPMDYGTVPKESLFTINHFKHTLETVYTFWKAFVKKIDKLLLNYHQ